MTRDVERPDWVPGELYPFRSHFLEIDGSNVHYVDEGSGPTLLFVHGNPSWSFLYRDIIIGLRDSFRCVAVDYPGFGLSTAGSDYGFTAAEHAGAVERLVVDVDLQDVTLMGQDWGGPIGLTVATRHPDRFRGFILGNTWAWPLNGIFHFEAFSRMMGNPVAKFWVRNANAFVNLMIPLGTASRPSGDVMRAYRGPFPDVEARTPTWEFARQLLRSEPFMRRLEEELPKLTHLPALFLWGGQDFALRKRVELPRLQRLFPHHETVVLERARHFFQEDAADDAASAIRDWMGRRGSGAAGSDRVGSETGA
ncbi:MAG: alpha/beta fold hydrolase [Actinomycetota bacterium]|nr:alpha/beta fold hydrolase [Actinomycetota bacterium]